MGVEAQLKINPEIGEMLPLQVHYKNVLDSLGVRLDCEKGLSEVMGDDIKITTFCIKMVELSLTV